MQKLSVLAVVFISLFLGVLACSGSSGDVELPGTVYYIDFEDKQVKRLETDAETVTSITDEPSGVATFDLKAGVLVYATGDKQIKMADASGQGVEVLFTEQNLDVTPVPPPVKLSPDGTQLAYFADGLYIYDIGAGDISLVLEHPYPGFEDQAYHVVDWSDDGRYLPLSFYSNDIQYFGILDLETGEFLYSDDGDYIGIYPAWLPDGRLLYINTTPSDGQGIAAWDLETDEKTEIVPDAGGSVENFAAFPIVVEADGDVRVRYMVSERASIELPPLYRFAESEVTGGDWTILNDVPYFIGVGAWHPSGEGILIEDRTRRGLIPVQADDSTFRYLSADGTESIRLPDIPSPFIWGN